MDANDYVHSYKRIRHYLILTLPYNLANVLRREKQRFID